MRPRCSFVIVCVLLSALLPAELEASLPQLQQHAFTEPIDALSVAIPDDVTISVTGWDGTTWTVVKTLQREDEQDPLLAESNLVIFPTAVTRVRFSHEIAAKDVHVIRVSRAPAQFLVAANGSMQPHILTRQEWGADETLLTTDAPDVAAPPDTAGDNGDSGKATTIQPNNREQDCKDMHTKYPDEFKASTAVTENVGGKKLRWPQQYSPGVRLLVVHHTAIAVKGDPRSGLERMRALYEFHAQNRGWGDIGYHYIIDDQGQIYEGRSGGDSVVGGHVYCNNVGTIGISMMGNFDMEQPTQEQTRSLQWLLKLLAEKYQIPVHRNVVFHGKTMPSIVGHRQLISTDCPGTAVWSALDQIRENVKSGNVDGPVSYPNLSVPDVITTESDDTAVNSDGLASLSSTVIEGRPGADVMLSLLFRANRKQYRGNTRIARIIRSPGVQVWQERAGKFEVARDLRMPVDLLKTGQSVVVRVKVRLPAARGNATLQIGSLKYTFQLSGRMTRGTQMLNTGVSGVQLSENAAPVQQSTRRVTLSSSSLSSVSSTSNERSLRILLTSMNGKLCSSPAPTNYRGAVKCEMVDGSPAWINQLPLEEYLIGVREEGDSEPYEKQKVFAIAARTYAFYYMDPAHRKFPGKPYDGTDSPESFQTYDGITFEVKNPQWVRAVRETEGQVLTYQGNAIKTPYFSSDTGRTRSPEEAGWKNYPFAEIFSPKDDPWCIGMELRGHGVGMSGCGVTGQIREGRTAQQILQYYYPGTEITKR